MPRKTEFPGFDEFVVDDSMTMDVSLQKKIRLIDSKRFVEVDLHSMKLKGDADNCDLNIREKGIAFTKVTSDLFAYVMLEALDGQRKLSTVLRWVNELSLFTRTIRDRLGGAKITTITLGMFNFYACLKSASQIKLLRSALKYWGEQGVPGVHPELLRSLRTSPAPKPRSMIEIQNTEPSERPFSIAQVRALLANIGHLYVDGAFTPQDNLLWRLIVSEAMRPSQMELLRVGDIKLRRDANGKVSGADLQVPIVKQAGTPAREYMMEYPVSEPVARAIDEHLTFQRHVLGRVVPDHWALFSVRRNLLLDFSITDQAVSITQMISKTRKGIVALSTELQDTDLFTRRFKHTKLTHLAILGAPLETIARAGFQTSTISLRRYVNLTDESFSAYESAMTDEHDLIVEAFQPRVISRVEARHQDPENRIIEPSMEDDLGACAASPCGVLAPYGCYICHRFEAFDDGPHEHVEAILLDRRQRSVRMKLPPETVVRDDHLLAAVRRVIRLVNMRR